MPRMSLLPSVEILALTRIPAQRGFCLDALFAECDRATVLFNQLAAERAYRAAVREARRALDASTPAVTARPPRRCA